MTILLFSTLFIVSAFSLNPQSVNLALETSIVFDPKDAENNVVFIKNLKKFLEQIQRLVLPNQGSELTFRTSGPRDILSEFLIDLGVELTNHTDIDLKNISILFNKIVDELYFKESLFHEIFIESKLKNFIRTVTKEWKNANATTLKYGINKCLTECDPVVSKFLRKLNKYYDDADDKKMKKIVKRLRKYPRKKKDLTKVIKDGIKYLVFDHYNALNYTSKLKLATQLQKLTDYLTESYKNKILDPDLEVDFRKTISLNPRVSNLIEPTSKVGKNIVKKELVLDKSVQLFITGNKKPINDTYILK